jgi:hypothetical protein
VCQNPYTSGKETLENSIKSPEAGTNRGRRNVLGSHKSVEDIECRTEIEKISSNIC